MLKTTCGVNSKMHRNNKISWFLFALLVFTGLFFSTAFASAPTNKLTDQEVIELAKLVKTLRAENQSYREQISLLKAGLQNSSKVVNEMTVQVQALISLQQVRSIQSDKIMNDLSNINQRSLDTLDKAERRLASQERSADFWRVIAIAAGIYAGTK